MPFIKVTATPTQTHPPPKCLCCMITCHIHLIIYSFGSWTLWLIRDIWQPYNIPIEPQHRFECRVIFLQRLQKHTSFLPPVLHFRKSTSFLEPGGNRTRVHTCLEQESMSWALLLYQSVRSSMEGVAVQNLFSSGVSSYKKSSLSSKFCSSTALRWYMKSLYWFNVRFTKCS